MPVLNRNDSLSQDLSSWPVQRRGDRAGYIASSQYNPAVERERAAAMALIRHLMVNPISWSDRSPVSIDPVSAETALAFIQRLPSDRALPKIAPDGDGSIALLWDDGPHRALIAIDRVMLHLVREPGRPSSFHFSPMRFDGETIPPLILNDLPRR